MHYSAAICNYDLKEDLADFIGDDTKYAKLVTREHYLLAGLLSSVPSFIIAQNSDVVANAEMLFRVIENT